MISKIVTYCFIVTFFLFILILFYKVYKESDNLFLSLSSSNDENLSRQYKENYKISKDILKNNKNVKIITDDGWDYFSLRYLIYPINIKWVEEKDISTYKNDKYFIVDKRYKND